MAKVLEQPQTLPEVMSSFFEGHTTVPSAKAFKDPKVSAKIQHIVSVIWNTNGLNEIERKYEMVKAMGTPDFPYLTGAIIERELLSGFNYIEETIEKVFRRRTRLNFNTKRAMKLDGGDQLLVEVTEHGMYQHSKVTETEYEYAMKLYGRVIALTLQMLANDDLDAFQDIPNAMGRGAKMTRQKFMTSLLLTTTGWKAALFSDGGAQVGGQTAVATTALDATNLSAALLAMAQYTDKNGNPIKVKPKYLWVNPGLEKTAFDLTESATLNTIVTGLASTSAKTTEQVSLINWIRSKRLEVLIDPFTPDVASSGTIGATAWGLFCDPNDQPAAEFGTWAMAPEPQILVEVPNQRSVSGGPDPFGTSFQPEAKMYKVRDAHGGVALFPQARWLSNGQ